MPAQTRARTGSSRLAALAGLACLGASAVMIVAGALFDGARGAISVAGASALVLAYFVSGQLIERQALQMADASGMTITMVSYAVRIGLVGSVLWLAMSTPAIAGALSSTWVAIGALVAVLGWLTGLMVGHARSRVPVYDQPYQAPAGWDE